MGRPNERYYRRTPNDAVDRMLVVRCRLLEWAAIAFHRGTVFGRDTTGHETSFYPVGIQRLVERATRFPDV